MSVLFKPTSNVLEHSVSHRWFVRLSISRGDGRTSAGGRVNGGNCGSASRGLPPISEVREVRIVREGLFKVRSELCQKVQHNSVAARRQHIHARHSHRLRDVLGLARDTRHSIYDEPEPKGGKRGHQPAAALQSTNQEIGFSAPCDVTSQLGAAQDAGQLFFVKLTAPSAQ